ncbi:MAG: hypothetical protein AAF353_13465 [Pseudomonadota bacterium]
MDLINEMLHGTLYFSLNPIAWVAAIVVSLRSRKLRSPFFAAIGVQTAISGLLMSFALSSSKGFPLNDMVTMVLVPGIISGILIAALVIACTKRRRLKRMLFNKPGDSLLNASKMA